MYTAAVRGLRMTGMPKNNVKVHGYFSLGPELMVVRKFGEGVAIFTLEITE